MAKTLDDLIREAARLSGIAAQSSGTRIDRLTAELLAYLVSARRAQLQELDDRQLHETMRSYMRRQLRRTKLTHLEHGRPWLTVAEIAYIWGRSKPTTRRLLRQQGLLQRRGNMDVVDRIDWTEFAKRTRRNRARSEKRLAAKLLHIPKTIGTNRKNQG